MMKETPADIETRDRVHAATAAELRQFIERHERLDEEKKAIAEQQKEVMAEAKGRGYQVKAIKKIIAMRKLDENDLAEQNAIVSMYGECLGMDV